MPKKSSTQPNPSSSDPVAIGPSGIVWTNERRKLSDMIDWPKNPRKLTDAQAAQIGKSFIKFGFVDPVILNLDNTILGGHQRKRVLLAVALAKPNTEVDVRVPSRLLDADEVEEINIRLNKNQGEFDYDKLANEFDEVKLQEWGFEGADFAPEGVKPGGGMGDAAQDHSFCPKCKRPY